ncbi:AI-2E family transporter [Elongatibacter sediminis]|uniref:AI-2E family transporter n=1 Tax=Elongatibacter sediminis TaxID=3119006 RepID=A0AAW9RNK5_9GAMM
MPEFRYLAALLGAAAAFWLLYQLAPVITPFAMAGALAYLGDPLVDRLERVQVLRWQMGRGLAVTLVFLLMFGVLAALLLIIIPLLIDQLRNLFEKAPSGLAWLADTAVPWIRDRFGLEAAIPDAETLKQAAGAYWKEAGQALLGVLGTVSAGGQAVMNVVMNLVLVPVVTFYLLRDWDALVEGVRTLLPRRAEPTVSRLTREIDEVLGAFLRGQLMVMLALGGVYATGLWLIGLDLAIIIGMGAGLLSIVPYLGTLVGVVAAVAAAIFQFQDVLHPVLALGVFAVGQSLEGMVLTPKLVGDKVGLHPVAVIFAVLAGGQLFGFLGILLALPVASALNVLVRYAHHRYRGSNLFNDADAGTDADDAEAVIVRPGSVAD